MPAPRDGTIPDMPQGKLPPGVTDKLGPYYVYALVDPRNQAIFYIGKGTGERLLAHGRQAELKPQGRREPEKLRRIREIRASGREPRIDVVRHGLDEATAFTIESALIDSIPGLTNAVGGHDQDHGRAPLVDWVSQYGAEPVEANAPPVVLIRLSRWVEKQEELEPGVFRSGHGYRAGMSDEEIADSARAWWRLSPDSVDRKGIKHAVAVHEGITRLVLEIGDWFEREDGRRGFNAAPVKSGPVYRAWVGELGKRVDHFFAQGAQTPVRYWLG